MHLVTDDIEFGEFNEEQVANMERIIGEPFPDWLKAEMRDMSRVPYFKELLWEALYGRDHGKPQ